MSRVVPITPPVTEEGSIILYGGILMPTRVVPISRVTLNEDGSVSLHGDPETRHYALEARPYFPRMVEGILKQRGIEFEKEIKDTGYERLITYRALNVSLPEVCVFEDGEATTMTGRLYETLNYDGKSIRFQDVVTSRERRRVVQDFRRFMDKHL